MPTVKVFQYERLNGRLDEFEFINRWATRDAILARGERRIIESSVREVDVTMLDDEGFLPLEQP